MSCAVIHLIPFLLLFKADKPAIVDAIWKVFESRVPADILDDDILYDLDAATFLQCTHSYTLHIIISGVSTPGPTRACAQVNLTCALVNFISFK